MPNLWSFVAIGFNTACALHYINNSKNYVDDPATRAVLGTVFIANVFLAIEKLILSKWTSDAAGPEEFRKRTGSNAKPLGHALSPRYVLDLLFNPRGLGRPWQVKNIPRFFINDPDYIPSKRESLIWSFVGLLLCFSVLDLESLLPRPDPRLYSLDLIPVFSRDRSFSSEEIIFRVGSTIIYWVNGACGMAMNLHFLAFVAVATGISNPKS